MLLIDANYIIRLFCKEPDSHFQKSKKLFEQVAKREIKVVISEGVLMECFFVLKGVYNYSREEVAQMLLTILKFENVINNEKYILMDALSILKKRNIDFIDALLCAKSKWYGYQVKSFDKDIKKCLKRD